MKTKRRKAAAWQDQFTMRRDRNREKVQIISHGRPVSHIVITDDHGGAVKLDADFLPSVREVLEHIRLVNDRLGARVDGELPN